jgi:hypothetical protein
MILVDAAGARELVEAAVVAFSVLGGVMAYLSGYFAAEALSHDQPPGVLARRVNEGIGQGFKWGSLAAVFALIIMVWT